MTSAFARWCRSTCDQIPRSSSSATNSGWCFWPSRSASQTAVNGFRAQKADGRDQEIVRTDGHLRLLNAVGLTGPKVESVALQLFGSKATAVMTNLPGPREESISPARRCAA